MNSTISPLVHGFVKIVFCYSLAVRFWTEYIDAKFGTPLSSLISAQMILLALFVFVVKHHRMDSGAHKVLVAWMLFIGSASISFIIGKPVDTGVELVQILKYLSDVAVLFMVFAAFRTEDDFRTLGVSIMVGMIPSLLFACYQGVTKTGFTSYEVDYARAYGLSTHPVLFGVQIVIILGCIGMLWEVLKSSTLARWISVVFFMLVFPALYFTFARTAWVVLAMALLFSHIKGGGIKGKLLAVCTLLMLTLILPLISDRFNDLFTLYDSMSDGSVFQDPKGRFESSVHWRIYNWYQMTMIGLESPWFGHGPGTAGLLSPYDRSSHSSVVDTFVEQGVVGVFFLAVATLSIRHKTKIERYYPMLSNIYSFRFVSMLLLLLAASMIFSISLINQTLNMLCISMMLGLRYKLPYLIVKKT